MTRPLADRVQMSRDGGPVILIVVDAMRPDRLSAYGAGRPTSPNLNRLADDGLVLANYYANGNWTRPSMASLMTGLLPAEHGVERDADRLGERATTMAELLRRKGIPTGAVIGNGNASSTFGLGRGFDLYADTKTHWQGLPTGDEVVELAMPFVRAHAAEPFFLVLFLVDPHDPYHAPAELEKQFVRDPAVALVRTPHWELGRYSAAQVERMQGTYDAALRYTDDVIGRFFTELSRLGVYERATILVTADHGEAFGEHGFFLHSHHLYEEIIRVPMIIRAPRMSARGGQSPLLFQSVDILPTLARAFGSEPPQGLSGVDMFEQLAHPERVDPGRTVISEFHNFGIKRGAIRSARYKIIYEEPADRAEFVATVGQRSLLPSVSFDRARIQMYDLVTDPFERTNLYRPELAQEGEWARLLGLLKRHRGNAVPGSMVKNIDPETRRNLRALGYSQ